jgi:hypothetical protein
MITRQDTAINADIQQEIKVQRYIWIFASSWLRAKVAKRLDSKFWDDLPRSLKTYDIALPNGRRVVSELLPATPALLVSEPPPVAGPSRPRGSVKEYKEKLSQRTGEVRDRQCLRCARRGIICQSQARGKACIACAKVKMRCDAQGSEPSTTRPAPTQATTTALTPAPLNSQRTPASTLTSNLASTLLTELRARAIKDQAIYASNDDNDRPLEELHDVEKIGMSRFALPVCIQ